MRPTLAILFVLTIFLSCVEDTPQYTISTTADPVEGGTISPAAGTHDEGTQLSFEATANDGYHFERWSGALTGTTNPQAHTLTKDVSVTAHFALTDTTPPVITLEPLSQLINQGDPYTPPTVTATDNIDGDLTESIVIGGDSVDTNTLGTYEVTYDVTDAAGNNAEQLIHTVTVAQNPNGDDDGDGVINFDDHCPNTPADTIVDDTGCEDTTPPVISVDPDSQVVLKGNDYVAPTVTATDNVDGDLTSSIETTGEADVDTNTKGTYTLTYSVSDTAGNAATATHTITVTDNPNADDDGDGVINFDDHCPNTPADTIVDDTGCEDTTPPVISVDPAEQTIEIGVDTYTPPTVTVTDDFDSGLTPTQEGDNVDATTLGTYVVTYTATDAAGNTATATHTVTVEDTTAPVINVVAEQTLEIGIDTYTEPSPTVADNSGETLTATKGEETVDATALGTYVVTYTATDSSGNTATATHTVTVEDTTAPVISVDPAEQTITVGTTYAEPTITITDNSGETLTATKGGDTVDPNTLGTYVVTYNATDSSGNAATEVTHTLTVEVMTSVTFTDNYTSVGSEDITFQYGSEPFPENQNRQLFIRSMKNGTMPKELFFSVVNDQFSRATIAFADIRILDGTDEIINLHSEPPIQSVDLSPGTSRIIINLAENSNGFIENLSFPYNNVILEIDDLISGDTIATYPISPAVLAEVTLSKNDVSRLLSSNGSVTINGTKITVNESVNDAGDIVSVLKANSTIAAITGISISEADDAIAITAREDLEITVTY